MEQSEPVGEAWKLDPDYHKMSDFLGVNVYDRNDAELAKKVYALKEWTGGKDITDTLWKMRNLQKELGHQFIGKPLIVEMYKNIRLNQDRQQQVTLPQQPIKNSEVKSEKKPQVKTQGTIQKAVAETVNQSIKGMVNQALGDKKMIQGAVQGAVQDAIKEAFK